MDVRVAEVKGVLFDFGNTLFAHAPLAVTIGESANRMGLRISDDDLVSIASRIDSAAMSAKELSYLRDLDRTVWRQRWLSLYALADEWGTGNEAEGLGEAINASMHAAAEWVAYPQVNSTLGSLRAHGLAVGIVSNTGWDVREVFVEHGMSEMISSFTLSYEVGFVKPDRRIFDAACVSLGLTPADVVMVGDDPIADSGAVRAGIRTLLLPPCPPLVDNRVADVLKLVGLGPDRH